MAVASGSGSLQWLLTVAVAGAVFRLIFCGIANEKGLSALILRLWAQNFDTFAPMSDQKPDYSFWTKYKKFAGNEIMLYVIMVLGIVLGIIVVSYFQNR